MTDEIEHDKPDAITRLRARVAQLEAALREIEWHKYAEYGIRRIARAALEDRT